MIDYYRTKKTTVAIDDVFDIPHHERTAEQFDALSGLKQVEKYLKTIPARQREIITMRIWEERSFAEIAETIGGTESSVKMAFSRSIRTLRTECGEATFLAFLLALTLPFVHNSYYIHI